MFDLLLIAIGAFVILSRINSRKNKEQKPYKKSEFFEFKERDLKKYFKADGDDTVQTKKKNIKNRPKQMSPKVQDKSIWEITEQKEEIPLVQVLQDEKKSIGPKKNIMKGNNPSPRDIFLYYELLSKPKSLRK